MKRIRSQYHVGLLVTVLVVVVLADTAASVYAVTLSTGTGDGSVNVDVNMFGAFGARSGIGGGAGDAVYDPSGPVGARGTTVESAVNIRLGDRLGGWLTSGDIGGVGGIWSSFGAGVDAFDVVRTDGLRTFEVESHFEVPGAFGVRLTQVLRSRSEVVATGAGIGVDALLTQVYEIAYLPDSIFAGGIDMELIRYFDGGLSYDGVSGAGHDGGAKTTVGEPDTTLLVQTDAPTGGMIEPPFVGVTGDAGHEPSVFEEPPTVNRFSIGQSSSLVAGISAGMLLDDLVFGDADADGAIDEGFTLEGDSVPGYDVSLGLASRVFVDPGETIVFVTHTMFGDSWPLTPLEPDPGPRPDPGPGPGPGPEPIPEPVVGILGLGGMVAIALAGTRRRYER